MWSGSWPSQRLQRFRTNLHAVRNLVDHPNSHQSDEVGQALARFLVIRACGYLEKISKESALAYVESKASPNVANFARSWFSKGRSPSPSSLVELVSKFDSQWSIELCARLKDDDEYLWRQISFLVELRNKIAHGESEGVGATRALDLVKSVEVVADWFLTKFDPR